MGWFQQCGSQFVVTDMNGIPISGARIEVSFGDEKDDCVNELVLTTTNDGVAYKVWKTNDFRPGKWLRIYGYGYSQSTRLEIPSNCGGICIEQMEKHL